MKKILINVFGRIWALWGAIFFVPTLLVAAPIIGLSIQMSNKQGMMVFRAVTRTWMTMFLYWIGSPLRVYGRRHYNPENNYVVVCNHSSMMDVPAMTPFFPGPNKTIAKKSMADIPFFGWVYRKGSVLVDRNSDASRRKSYDDMKKVLLHEGWDMVIYPEGTRNRTGRPLKDFYEGAFRLAADVKKDIQPVVLLYTAKVLPPGKPFFLWPHRIEMHLLPLIKHEGRTVEELKTICHQTMWQFIEKQQNNK